MGRFRAYSKGQLSQFFDTLWGRNQTFTIAPGEGCYEIRWGTSLPRRSAPSRMHVDGPYVSYSDGVVERSFRVPDDIEVAASIHDRLRDRCYEVSSWERPDPGEYTRLVGANEIRLRWNAATDIEASG